MGMNRPKAQLQSLRSRLGFKSGPSTLKAFQGFPLSSNPQDQSIAKDVGNRQGSTQA